MSSGETVSDVQMGDTSSAGQRSLGRRSEPAGSAVARTATAQLPADAGSPRRARRFLRQQLIEWGMADLADAAELMVSELVTNAVVHARSASTVIVRNDGVTLRVEVSDRGDGSCTLRDPDVTQDNGRGLRFVDALAERWGTVPMSLGKTVWFELPRP